MNLVLILFLFFLVLARYVLLTDKSIHIHSVQSNILICVYIVKLLNQDNITIISHTYFFLQ